MSFGSLSPSMSSTSILSQQSSLTSTLSSGIPIPSVTTQIADNAILKEKKELDLLLNTSMTQLHTKFGQNTDQQIQQEIHKKLNALKLLVSVIEKRANQKHIEIDKELDESQSALKTQTELQHQTLENQRNEELNAVYSRFRDWIDTNLSTTNHQQPPNQNGNIVIITDSNNNVMNAFIMNSSSNNNLNNKDNTNNNSNSI